MFLDKCVSLCVVVMRSLLSCPFSWDKSHRGLAPCSRPSLIISSNWSESMSPEKTN